MSFLLLYVIPTPLCHSRESGNLSFPLYSFSYFLPPSVIANFRRKCGNLIYYYTLICILLLTMSFLPLFVITASNYVIPAKAGIYPYHIFSFIFQYSLFFRLKNYKKTIFYKYLLYFIN